MTSTNLHRDDAAARAELIDSIHYNIELDLSAGATMDNTTFGTTTKVSFSSGTGSTFIDLRASEVRRVTLDGLDITDVAVPVGASGRYDATRGIQLGALEAGPHELVIDALGEYSTTGEGLHRFLDPVDNEVYMYTQFETADAKRVFACFDQPDLKATYDLTVTTPEAWTVVTNNTVRKESTAGTAVHYSSVDYQLSTYLIALCVGPWFEVHDSWTGRITEHPETAGVHSPGGKLTTSGEMTVPLGLYCRQSLASFLDANELFTITKQGFDYYAEHFGVGYPFYKYDQIFCPEYNMGAMENAGCVTIRDEYIFRSAASHYQYERRADTILHELAHMWFGDLVTMKWWDDLWLNESFATWSAAMSQAGATKYTTAWVTFANKEKAWAYGQDQLSSTHPVFSDASDIVTVDANFDGITYAKGASVLKQLAAYVGEAEFFAGIRAHFAAHAWGNATFADLLSALEKASGRDLSDWADQWLKTTGINTLAATFSVAEDGAYSDFVIHQSGARPSTMDTNARRVGQGNGTAGETRSHRIAVGVYALDEQQRTIERISRAELDIAGETTDVAELVGTRAGDVVLVNDDDLTYAFMTLDATSLETVTRHVDKFADPMARSLIWSAAWQMTRNAQMRARDFLSLIALGLTRETELAVLEQLIGQAITAVNTYADPQWAPTGWSQLHSTFLEGMRSTTGSAQLAFARGLAGCVHTQSSATLLSGLLAENQSVAPGLDVDQDLRWSLIIALTAAANATGDSAENLELRITDELKRDASSTGAMLAAQARAAVPTVDNKQRVWKRITTEGASMSNLALRHSILGLTHVGHGAFLKSCGEDYPHIAVNLWNSLSPEMALRTLEGIYPSWDMSDPTDSAVAQLIDAGTTPAGLRRTLMEGRDRVARAKIAQEFDRSGQPAVKD